MKPAKMCKISITGHKDQLQKTIDTLYRLRLFDIQTYDGELDTGNPFDEAEEFSQMLVDTRSLLSTLPEAEGTGSFQLSQLANDIETVKEKVDEFERKQAELADEKRDVKTQLDFLKKLKGAKISIEDLEGSDTLETFVGKFDKEELEEATDHDLYEVFEGKDLNLLAYRKDRGMQEVLREIGATETKPPQIDYTGDLEKVLTTLKNRRDGIKSDLDSLQEEYREYARKWRPKLEDAESFLTERVEKAEAPLSFATTDSTFIAEGWIPHDKFNELGEELHRATGGKIHIQEEQTDEEPPTKHENNVAVKPFESLTDLVSVPRHNEIDPSFLLMLTFPLMFGFMIGDAGYGLTTLAVFYGGYRLFPAASEIFKSLMYASIATVAFGLAFGDAFGYVIFGHHSQLASATGIHLFEQIPILFHRAEHLGDVFTLSVVIGLAHVNLGYLVGFYNEFMKHGLKEAFLEKISWILLEIGAFAWYVFGAQVGAPVLLISLVMLYVGEGVEGMVEIPSLLSNILSYFRIFGVSVAAVSLAAVVNAMADPLFGMGNAVGFALGTVVLVVGHVFNTFVKIMEGFLQGIRLHYVEMFTKFYEGGGRKYAPFGGTE
ncbi:V-type ATP synthase subunit I [Candidatus Nanohalococcus occultus]|uniref:V-type ATP synthase subunit I n=1 Tax=Candidatus Nanohalococcus occultus TaxID=2978047 RepID=UPI0039DF4F25